VTDTYTHGHGAAVLSNHATRTTADSLSVVLPHLSATSRVLDVGCGPGSITLDLASMIAGLGGAASQVTGVENTPEPLREARAAAASRGIGARFVPGDAYHLPFRSGEFDVVVAHQVLQHLTDPVAALTEMLRVAAPGGLVAVRDADYAGMFFHPAPAGLLEWQSRYRSVARGNGAQPDAARRLVDWALAAGCTPDQLSFSCSTWVYAHATTAVAGDAAWLAGSWIRRTGGERYRDQLAAILADGGGDGDGRAAAEAAVRRITEGWMEWAEDPSATFVMPHGELLIRVDGPVSASGEQYSEQQF
jgi:SAM-dependent methyltransferase